MAWRSSGDQNEEMVKTFKMNGVVTTKIVENAFLNVPRAAFLPEDLQDEAYVDSPIRGDDHLHMSAPHMYATVLEALDLKPGMSFLNVGSGTGYFSMLAGFIIGPEGVNHGIELRANLVEHANECCDEFFLYTPKMKKEICYPQFIAGNCFYLDVLAYKYDRVYCGAACPRSKLDFLLQLVKPEGFVVVPSGSKLLKVIRVVPSGANETILSDVCFESLVLPDASELCPKLRFAGVKVKSRKIKVYPPPGLLVSKTSARKSLAKMRALQDVVDCLTESRTIPKAFAYVPSFIQISQLTEKSKSNGKDQAKHPVDQTIDFFTLKSLDKKERDLSEIIPQVKDEIEGLWGDIQNDTVWESVVDYTYSLCSTTDHLPGTCLQVYTKSPRKKSKRSVSPGVSGESCVALEEALHGAKSAKNVLENLKNLLSNAQTLEKSVRTGYSMDCDTVTSSEGLGSQSLKQCPSLCSDDIAISAFSSSHEENPTPNSETSTPSLNEQEMEACGNSCTNNSRTCKESSLLNTCAGPANLTSRASESASYSQQVLGDLNECSAGETMSQHSNPETAALNHKKAEEIASSHQPNNKKIGGRSRPNAKTSSRKQLCPIKLDEYLTDKLATAPSPSWTSDEDMQLVQLLVNSFGSGTSKINSKCSSKHISVLPSLFSPSILVRYPKISSYTPESLTFRALALFRVVHVIDSVIPFLCSASPAVDSITKPLSERPYPLTSFSDSSFSSLRPAVKGSQECNAESEADIFLTSGVENIRKRKDCIQQKIDLHKYLQGQFKEQHTLLKKQIQLIEEQSIILQHVESREKSLSTWELEQLRQTQQRVNEQKSKRYELIGKQVELAKERQQNDHDTAQLKSQMERLQCEEVKFLQLIERQKLVKKKLGEIQDGLKNVEKPPSILLDSANSRTREDSKHRYNASYILSSLRFLLPLSSRRAVILGELLRATEQPLPEVPVIYVDRRASVSERLSNPRRSVFYQIFEELKNENMTFRWNKRKCDQWWEVKFVGEGIIDQGGGFRDSLAELSDELCPQDPEISQILPLFVRSVNQRDQIGEYRDCFVPNPSCKDMKMFHWLGKLMGASYRSDESLTLYFPPFIWKLLAGEHVTWCADFASVDEASVNLINNIEMVDSKEFSERYANDLDFTTAFSDGNVVEIKENGGQKPVDYATRLEYCELVKKTRMMESLDQVKAMRDGLLTVIPQSLLEFITSQELERGVCGFDDISISQLKESIHYGDELSSDSDCVLQLWKVLEGFTTEDRSRFLRFVTGRKRLPACITLSQLCGEKDTLPSASTCASTLMLPSYSSVQVAEKKLRYAIYNCVAIDTDTSPW